MTAKHKLDELGNPAGGVTKGIGFKIKWQDGPLGRGPERREPNGAFVESILEAAKDRLEWYQTTRFRCHENDEAIQHLVFALAVLNRRTREREARGVEGTHQP